MVECLNNIQRIIADTLHFIENIDVNHLGFQVFLILHSLNCIFAQGFSGGVNTVFNLFSLFDIRDAEIAFLKRQLNGADKRDYDNEYLEAIDKINGK